MKLKSFLILGFLVVIFIWVFRSWLLSPAIASGDWWYYFLSMYSDHFFHPYSWYQTVIANGLGAPGFVYINVNIVVALALKLAQITSLSWSMASKLFFYIPFVLLSLFSSILFIKRILPGNRFWFLAPIIFSLNTYILMMTGGGQIITALSYALSPITLYLFIRLISLNALKENASKIILILSAFSLSLQTILDLRIAFVTGIAILAYLIVTIITHGFKKSIKPIVWTLCSFIIVVFVNSYWVIPILIYGIDPIKQLGAAYSSVDAVKYLSFAKFENSFGLLHPYYPENIFGKVAFMDPAFLILPLLAFSSLIFLGKDKTTRKLILFFALLGLAGVFLGKGASEPFGNVYVFLFSHVPGFQLFRDSFKWYLLIAISYMVLIPYFFDSVTSWLEIKYKSKYIYAALGLLSVLILIFLSRDAFLGKLTGTFVSRNLPVSYSQLNNYLSSDKSFYRTLWVPENTLFSYYSNNQPAISARDFFSQYDFKSLTQTLSTDEARQELLDAGVKYVIIPEDSEQEIYLTDRKYDDRLYQNFVASLGKVPWLHKDKTFGKVVVYRLDGSRDHFFCDCSAEISYKYVNPTNYIVSIKDMPKDGKLIFSESFDPNWKAQGNNFDVNSAQKDKFNSFSLPKGTYSFYITYLPQKYVDAGLVVSLVTLISSLMFLLVLLFRPSKS